jgi:MoxR-like ATPase
VSELESSGGDVQQVQAALQLFGQGREQIGRVIAGQQELIEQALLTLLCGGHALVEGVPGVAKTLAVKTLARFLSLVFRRVQGTPDMMPADILGTTVFSPKTNEFSLHKGPVFTQFLLADEINRMPPRTRAALLESMEERQVTMDGDAHLLDDYFTVFATQNPLEFEGRIRCRRRNWTVFLSRLRLGIRHSRRSAAFWSGTM